MSSTKPLGQLFRTKKKGVPDTPTFIPKDDSASHMVPPSYDSQHFDQEPMMKLPIPPPPPIAMKVGFKGTPAVEFVSQLRRKQALRKEFVKYIAETAAATDGVDRFGEWLSDHGFAATSSSVLDAMDMVMDSDLLFWSGRYDLFVVWSTDRRHPWDSVTSSETSAAVLEIGSQAGSGKAQVLLNGKIIPKFTFQHGVFRTDVPVEWKTPEGSSVSVNLQMQMAAAVTGVDSAYIGIQARGVLWPAPPPRLPALWPVGPPTIIGKLNITARSAAVSPGTADALETFQGVYEVHHVGPSKKLARLELSIVMCDDEVAVMVNDDKLSNFRFSANNVLSWESVAHSGWLLFSELPAGPYCIGHIAMPGEAPRQSFNVFGEPKGQPSVLASDMVADPTIGQMLSHGVTSASVIVCSHLLRAADKMWALASQGLDTPTSLPDEVRSAVATMERFISVGQDFDTVFPYNEESLEINATAAAEAAASENVAAAEVQKAYSAAEAASVAVEMAEEESRKGNSQDATAAGAAATLESAKAAAAAGAAEAAALAAGELARKAHTRAALEAASAAAQSYNQAKDYAHEAAMGAVCAAMAALKAVESDLAADYASSKDYARLKNHAEANGLALKAMATARETLDAWEEGTSAGRKMAQSAAVEAAEHAANCNTYMRAANRNQAPPSTPLALPESAAVTPRLPARSISAAEE